MGEERRGSAGPTMLANQLYLESKKEYERESFQRRYSLHKATEAAVRESMMRDEVSQQVKELQEAQALQDMLQGRRASTSARKSYRRVSIAKAMPGPRQSQMLMGVAPARRPSAAQVMQMMQAQSGRPSVFVNQAGQSSPVNMVPYRPSGYIDIPRPSVAPPPLPADNLNQSIPWSRGDYGAGYYAGLIMQDLFAKPWEKGGHVHDFCGMCRGSTCDDIPQYYEPEPDRIARHEGIVAALVAWNKQRQLKADMLNQLGRLHSIAKTRRQFQMMRRHVKLPLGMDPAAELAKAIRFPDGYKDGHVQADLGKVQVDLLGHVDVGWHNFNACPHYMFPLLPCSRARPNKPPARPIADLLVSMQLDPQQLTADPLDVPFFKAPEIVDLEAFDERLQADATQQSKYAAFQAKHFKG